MTKLKIFLFAILLSALCFLGSDKNPALAVTNDNVSGWAWNSNIGWISFNSTDCDTDGDGIYEGASEFGGAAPAACPSSGTVIPYGVDVDPATGAFSGYAWNSILGWISFNRSDTGNPLSDDPGSGSGAIAKVDVSAMPSASLTVLGWAKILSLGNNGWIKFSHSSSPQNFSTIYTSATYKLSGWAWNGNSNGSGVGWFSFSPKDCDINGDGSFGDPSAPAGCPASGTAFSYGVDLLLNDPPKVTAMSAPNWSNFEACNNNEALKAKLQWTYLDNENDQLAAYRIRVNVAGVSEVLDTGKCIGFEQCAVGDSNCTASECRINVALGFASGTKPTYEMTEALGLTYSTNYTWTVQVWDAYGTSTLYAYNSNSAADTDGNSDNNPATFTTYVGEFPEPDFSWFPLAPNAGEEILFDGRISTYGNSGTVCDEANCAYFWSDPNSTGTISFSPDNTSTSTIIFNNSGQSKIRLNVMDRNINYSCYKDSDVFDVKLKMPSWIETKK